MQHLRPNAGRSMQHDHEGRVDRKEVVGRASSLSTRKPRGKSRVQKKPGSRRMGVSFWLPNITYRWEWKQRRGEGEKRTSERKF